MFARFMPKEAHFFDLFREHAEQIVLAAREQQDLMRSGVDDLQRRVLNIKAIEKRADEITQSAIDLLHQSFITPIDRDDIHRLITGMDDIVDLVEDAAQSFLMYDIRSVTPEAGRLAEFCLACAEKVKAAVDCVQKSIDLPKLLALCGDIDQLESEADHVMRDAMAKLFRDEPDVRQLIKLRAIYEIMESMTDRCKDVANVIQGIAIENS